MRAPRFSALPLVAALLLGGCGEGDVASSAFPFVSKAHAGEGEAIRLVFQPGEGEVYTMKLATTGGLTLVQGERSQEMPLDMTMAMTYRCARVRPDGGREVVMSVDAFDSPALAGSPGVAAALRQLTDVRTVMHMDRHGAVERVEMQGGDAATRQQVEQMWKQPGSNPFLPYPPDGIRVGEAIDYTKLFAGEQFQEMLGAAAKGIEVDVKGEAVLVRRLEVEGQDAVEFAVNLVMNMRGRASPGRESVEMDVGLKLTGTQFVSVATGMPVGRLTMQIEARGAVTSGGETGTLRCEISAVGDVEKTLASEAPAEPDPAPRER